MARVSRDSIKYILLIAVGMIMIYPFVWMCLASFKSNDEIFGSLNLLPSKISFAPFAKGWEGSGQYTYTNFFSNSFWLVIPTTLFTVLSSVVVSYAFARLKFHFKNAAFMLMIATLMLPNAVVIIPRYMIFNNLHWVDSYLPFIVPALLACNSFFIFMMVQFFRGLPKELDESAYIDGCNSFEILVKILAPLCKPAIISAFLFQFIWTWNDFFNSLIYINSVSKYTVTLGLRMSLDNESGVTPWNQVMAMSFMTIVPCVLLFFFAQKYFVEGIATTGLKG
ncbi:carbohydrate ABC transporter permease [Cohnella zeiphila]|uniref:Carbohydrate ABC transporter permease n=1 Tax=Cohnella zeiphila TaxID=2761120 RepID=A0A7X0SRP1_9BACL|nr:carbohydrate ABC transporter permease [Cohnella zeiphila]MBB6734711.1 carbohydrate ABC transporter permease [Cohnella zeiphila]